jgi:microcystin-dependent protein
VPSPRCGCASDQCSCHIIEGPNVSISGSGSRNDPYVIGAATQVVNPDGGGGGTSTREVGEMIMFGGNSVPAKWLLCAGSAVSRAVYSDLFAVIGTAYGAGDGSSTFNLPNLTGRFPLGISGGHARGEQAGSETKVLTEANLPPHDHAINHDHPATDAGGTHDHQLQRSGSTGAAGSTIPTGGTLSETTRLAIADDGSHTHEIPAYTGQSGNGDGTSTPVNVMPPSLAVNFLIRTEA